MTEKKAGFIILNEDKIDGIAILKIIETTGRIAYQSEWKISKNSYIDFAKMILKRGHESVIEHATPITVIFINDRGVSHEEVRHRLASFTQESTRYCDYSEEKTDTGISVITPFFYLNPLRIEEFDVWFDAMLYAEKAYNKLISLGSTPQEARSVLPNSLKTQIAITANLREWRHIFKLRAAPSAHPQMRELMIPLLKKFQELIPVIFDEIPYDMEWYRNNVESVFKNKKEITTI